MLRISQGKGIRKEKTEICKKRKVGQRDLGGFTVPSKDMRRSTLLHYLLASDDNISSAENCIFICEGSY